MQLTGLVRLCVAQAKKPKGTRVWEDREGENGFAIHLECKPLFGKLFGTYRHVVVGWSKGEPEQIFVMQDGSRNGHTSIRYGGIPAVVTAVEAQLH